MCAFRGARPRWVHVKPRGAKSFFEMNGERDRRRSFSKRSTLVIPSFEGSEFSKKVESVQKSWRRLSVLELSEVHTQQKSLQTHFP